jgi:Phage integrase family/Phage integrase SAM-like domain
MLMRSNRRKPIESGTRLMVPQSPSCGFSFCAQTRTHPVSKSSSGRVRPPVRVGKSTVDLVRFLGEVSSDEVPAPASVRLLRLAAGDRFLIGQFGIPRSAGLPGRKRLRRLLGLRSRRRKLMRRRKRIRMALQIRAAKSLRISAAKVRHRARIRRLKSRRPPKLSTVLLIENTLRLTARSFLHEHYFPERAHLCDHVIDRTLRSFVRLSKFLAAEVVLDQLDEPLLLKFAEWCQNTRWHAQTPGILADIRRVWRCAWQHGLAAVEPPRIRRRRKSRPPWSMTLVEVRASRRKSGPATVTIGSNSPRTLRNFLRDVYVPRRMVGCKPLSARDYVQAIDALRDFVACEPTVDQLTDDLLEGFAAWCLRSGSSPVTVNGRVTRLCTLWRFAYRKKLVETLPRDIQKLRVPKRVPEAWSVDQFGMILASASEGPGTFEGMPASLWWTGFLFVLYDTGLRVSALLKLDAAALDVGTGWLTVPPDLQKNGSGQAFRLHAQTLDALIRFPRTSKLLPCPWREPKGPLTRWFKQILKRAGLPHGRRDMFHRIRRTTATLVDNVAGLEAAKQQLGHSSPSVTKRYVDPRLSTRQFVAADSIARPTIHCGRPEPMPSLLTSAEPLCARVETATFDEEKPLPWLD